MSKTITTYIASPSRWTRSFSNGWEPRRRLLRGLKHPVASSGSASGTVAPWGAFRALAGTVWGCRGLRVGAPKKAAVAARLLLVAAHLFADLRVCQRVANNTLRHAFGISAISALHIRQASKGRGDSPPPYYARKAELAGMPGWQGPSLPCLPGAYAGSPPMASRTAARRARHCSPSRANNSATLW